jgi:hypothetical protein
MDDNKEKQDQPEELTEDMFVDVGGGAKVIIDPWG